MSFPASGRVAVYYAPEPKDSLFTAGASWLGCDPETGAITRQSDIPGIEEITAEPRRYGFHATLKPPMRLIAGARWEDVVDAAHDLAGCIAPFDLPTLGIADLHGFLALRETAPSPALQALADLCIAALDQFRAPPGEAELERRRRHGLPAVEEALLRRWGYPYVFGAWFFHMTLTRRLRPEEHPTYRPAAERHFAAALRTPRRVDAICLFTQSEPDAPFTVALRLPLRG